MVSSIKSAVSVGEIKAFVIVRQLIHQVKRRQNHTTVRLYLSVVVVQAELPRIHEYPESFR
jgi:hypothetical protein